MVVQSKKHIPVKPVRVRMSKKDRLASRWFGQDRFWRARAMGQIA
jgi:hypothetical protein